MAKIRTAVIGAGKVAETHARVLSTLPDSEFVAVYNRTPDRANALATRYQVQPYTDIATMVRETGAQAAIVCTPHPAHAAIAVEAIKQGMHLLIEKPLAASLPDCDAMIAAAAQHRVKLGVISQRRWYEPSRRVKEAIDAGKLGKPILGTAVLLGWRDQAYYASDPWRGKWETEGGGVLVNQAPHLLDLLLWYMGEIEEVFGYWANLNHPYIEVEDTAVAVIRFKSGALGNVALSNSQKPGLHGKVHIFGENGATIGVQSDGGSMFIAGMTSIQEPPINDVWTVAGEGDLLLDWQQEDHERFALIEPIKHYLALQIEDFLHSISAERDPAVTAQDGRRVVELFSAIYESQQTKMPVRFPVT